jgi:hypothetical protein
VNRSPITLCGSLSLHPSPGSRDAQCRLPRSACPSCTCRSPCRRPTWRPRSPGCARGIRGFGVRCRSLSVIPLLDRSARRRIGAVNTIVNEVGEPVGPTPRGRCPALSEVLAPTKACAAIGGARPACSLAFSEAACRSTREPNAREGRAAGSGRGQRRRGRDCWGPASDRLEGIDAIVNCSSEPWKYGSDVLVLSRCCAPRWW